MTRKHDIVERTRAAVAYLNTGASERTELFAFLSIFHPEFSLEKRLRLVNEAHPFPQVYGRRIGR